MGSTDLGNGSAKLPTPVGCIGAHKSGDGVVHYVFQRAQLNLRANARGIGLHERKRGAEQLSDGMFG
jgi:hypothetical protein